MSLAWFALLLLMGASARADKLFPGPPAGFLDAFAIPEPTFGRNLGGGNGYLPPPATCTPTTVAVTSTRLSTRVVSSTPACPGGQVVTRTDFTTVVRSDVQTQVASSVAFVTRDQTQQVFQTQTRTVGGRDFTTTQRQVVTSTGVVSSVVSSQVVSQVERTVNIGSTRVETQVVPFTVTRTDARVVSVTNTVPGPAQVVTSTQVSNVQVSTTVQPPPRTVTATQTQTQVQTRVTTVTPRPMTVGETKTVVETMFATITSTQERVVTQTQTSQVVRTSVRTDVQFITQTVPTTVVRTSTVGSTAFATVTRTGFSTVQVVSTRVVDATQPGQVVQVTRTEQRLVTSTVQQGVDVVTSTAVTTRVQESVVFSTIGVDNTIVVTNTITQPCQQTTYNYDEPAVAFGIGR